ncbi:MAG: MFS transporter, partial [Sideroxyarcus sp.]|nr:MFS transporter [Sideroxyarcus sp.]
MMHFRNHFSLYALRGEITELYIANTLREFGASMIGLYIPIYLYEVFDHQIVRVLFLFVLMHVLIILFSPIAAKLNGRFGVKHTMLLSVPFLNLHIFSLIQLQNDTLYIVPMIIGFAVAVSLYWVGLHTDFARNSGDARRGFNVGGFRAFMMLAALAGPFFGGLIIAQFGFQMLFLIVIVLESVALLPLFLSPDVHDPYDVHFMQELRSIFRKERWRDILAFFGEGFETKTAAYIWPIFLFTTLGGVTIAGGITSASLLIAMILGLFVGRFIDARGHASFLKLGAFGTALAWLARIFALTPASIFLVDSVAKLSANVYQVPY